MTCLCGHVDDEHDPRTRTCEINGCQCACFEAADEDDE